MKNKELYYTKAAQVIMGALVTAMSWMVVQLYGNLNHSVDRLEVKFDKSDEKLAQYMLVIEKRLENLSVRVDNLEKDD